MSSARKIGLLFDSVSDKMGDKAIGLVLQRIFAARSIPFEIVDPFRPDLSNIAMLVIGGGELIRTPGHPFYDAFRVGGPHVLNSVGVLDGAVTKYLDEYPIVTVRTEADRARLGRGEVVPCLTLLYPDHYPPHQSTLRVPNGAIGVHLTVNFRDEALPLARLLRRLDVGPVVFLPLNHYQGDEKIETAVSAAIPGSQVLPRLTPDEAFAVIGRLRLLITSSLHATLFAYARGTPFLTYGVMPKIEAFLGERGLARQVVTCAADIESRFNEAAHASDLFQRTFEQDRDRCRKLVDRMVLAAETALGTPRSKTAFAVKATDRTAYEREMAGVFATGMHAADSLEARVEIEGLEAELVALDGENTYLQTQCDELQTENAHLQRVKHELLASNSWLVTSPLRQIARGLRSVGIEPRKILPLLDRTPEPEIAGVTVGRQPIARSPEHMPLIGTLACDTDLKLIALQDLENESFQPDLDQHPATGHNFERGLDFWRQRGELAKRIGIYGFCLPYRSARSNSPVRSPWLFVDDSLAATTRFCIWLGRESVVKSPSKRGDTIDRGHFSDAGTLMRELVPILEHPQYIRIHNRPLILMTEGVATAQTHSTEQDLRQYCRLNGTQDPFVVVMKASGGDLIAAEGCGPDGLLELVLPEGGKDEKRLPPDRQSTNPEVRMHDYRSLIERSYEVCQSARKIFRSIFAELDTSDQEPHEVAFEHASPAGYQEWLENVCGETDRLFDSEERLVFIQGWNSATPEERFGWDNRHGYGYANATAQALNSIAARKEMSPLKAAVVVHAYYPELWPEISDLLKSWDGAFGLYVTVPVHADASFAEAIRAEWPAAIVSSVENRGRDMAPFLTMATRAIDDGYSLICKVHTKKSPHLGRGHFWRRDMLIKLLGKSVEQIRHTFRQNAALGMIAPEGHVLSGTHQFRLNKRHLTALLKRLGHDEDPLPFVFSAGSMFWIRADAMRSLLNLKLRSIDFETERGQLDGTLAHALERAFSLAARLQGYRIADTRVVGKVFGPSNLRSELELAAYEPSLGGYW